MPDKRRLSEVLGGFSVIVIGVFVALAADSWYQGWSESRGLEGYLDRLIVDLEADSSTFQFVLDVLDRKDQSLEDVAKVSLGLESPDSSFFEALSQTQSMGFQTPGTQRATYDDMIATGNLRLIQAAGLRAQLVAYYDQTDAQWLRIDRRRTAYPHAIYRLDPSPWDTPDFASAYPSLAAQALDSVRTLGFTNLLSAERTLSLFQREMMIDALELVEDLLATVRDARESA